MLRRVSTPPSRFTRSSRYGRPRRGRPLGSRRRRRTGTTPITREQPVWPLPDLADLPSVVIGEPNLEREVEIGYVRPAAGLLPARTLVPYRTPVFAVGSGVIFYTVKRDDGLIEVSIDHRNGYWSTYGGLLETTHPIGKTRHRVARGEIIGYVGAGDDLLRPLRFGICQLTRDALAFPMPIDPMIVMQGRVHLSTDREIGTLRAA